MKWFRNIIRSGLQGGDEYQRRRGVLLSNYIALTVSCCLVLLFVTRRFFFADIPGGITPNILSVGLTICLSPILANRRGWTTLSRLLVCFAPVLFIWYAYISLMMRMAFIPQSAYDSVRIHLLAMSFIPYLVLDKRRPLLLMLGILPTLCSLLFLDSFLNQFGLGVRQRGLPDEEYMLMGSRTLAAYGIISVSCFIFQSIITYNDDLNKRILSELKSKSELVISQNEALRQGQDRLNEINLHLEDLVAKKTKSIKEQNKLLLKYAHSNAHHVRGPIARVLGLIRVSRLETNLNYPWFFEKVEQEAKSADEIIIRIARELDNIDQHEFL